MANNIDIDINQMLRLETSLRAFPEIMSEELTTAMRQSTDLLAERVREEPPQEHKTRASVYGTTFKSDKQRRFFFAALRRGEITVPYIRTGGLAASWEKLVEVTKDVITGRVFTNAPEAKWVQGDERSLMLANHKKARVIAGEAKPEIFANFSEAVLRGIARFKGGVGK